MSTLPELSDFDWDEFRSFWTLDAGVTYLNHGSFGPSPDPVRRARERYTEELERQPMDFLIRRLEDRLDHAAQVLGSFVGAQPSHLAFVPNATCAMNVVTRSVDLNPGDEVLLTDQEYGAVTRLWGKVCGAVGAGTTLATLPSPAVSPDTMIDTIGARITPRTRLIVVSHVTSQTATVFPVEHICRMARERGVPVCIDGPHALLMRPLELEQLGCDYYCASGHKWLAAPFGSGFLFVNGRRAGQVNPAVRSWGMSLSGRPFRWQDELHWFGTYDPAPFLAMVDAISFIREIGVDRFRQQTHALARFARQRLVDELGAVPLTADSDSWYGSMVTLRLPHVPLSDAWPGKPHPLQIALWEQHRIELPIMQWKNAVHARVSCHLYNRPEDIERLVTALKQLAPPDIPS